MRRLLFISLLLASGCGTTQWHNDSKGNAYLAEDVESCEYEAIKATASRDVPHYDLDKYFAEQKIIDACIALKGWYEVYVPPRK